MSEERTDIPADPDAYEAPCIVDVDTETAPATTAAMIQSGPG